MGSVEAVERIKSALPDMPLQMQTAARLKSSPMMWLDLRETTVH
jgi:hypothetical protein